MSTQSNDDAPILDPELMSAQAAKTKGITSEVAGDPHIVLAVLAAHTRRNPPR